jgi:hypothetical protein
MIEKLPENYGIVVDIMGEKELNHYAVAIMFRDMRDKINEIIDLLPTNNKQTVEIREPQNAMTFGEGTGTVEIK